MKSVHVGDHDQDRKEVERLIGELSSIDLPKLGGALSNIVGISLRHAGSGALTNATVGLGSGSTSQPSSSPTHGSHNSNPGLALASQCWDWMLAATNLRATMYRLPLITSRQRIKLLSARTIPAEPATTSAIAALSTLELLKVNPLMQCYLSCMFATA
jgi:hypothetical protein